MQELGQWTRNLALRCQELLGEVGEENIYSTYRQGERLARAFCQSQVEARCVVP